jgi:hypothetical protein
LVNGNTLSVALMQPPALLEWEHGEIQRITGLLARSGAQTHFSVTTDPHRADLVVLLESCSFKSHRDIPSYRSLPFLQNRCRLYCINYEDGPPGFLPGLYSSLERFRFDPGLHVCWPHLRFPNELIDRLPASALSRPLELLFSFSGSCSHPMRRRLFDRVKSGSRWVVREINKWYNHNAGEKHDYVDEILRSKFVLCPRGIASYSHRIIETIALGRVPVIIADDWVPFSIEDRGYYIRIAEKDVERVAPLLSELEPDYEQYRAAAARVHEKFFAPDVRYTVAINKLCDFHRARQGSISFEMLDRRWRSRKFHHSNGWCLEQRVTRRARRWRAQLLSRFSESRS